jgi:hypothetical protein
MSLLDGVNVWAVVRNPTTEAPSPFGMPTSVCARVGAPENVAGRSSHSSSAGVATIQ